MEKEAGLNWLFKKGLSKEMIFELRHKEYIWLLDIFKQ